MKPSYTRISLAVSITMFVLLCFCLTGPGGQVWILCLAAIFTIPPIVFGSKRERILGIMFFVIIISAAIMDYRAGRRFLNRIREMQRIQTENASP